MLKKIAKKIKLVFVPCHENKFRPYFLKNEVLFYCILILLFIKISIIPFSYFLPENTLSADLTRASIIEMTNSGRESLGLNVLKENKQLDYAALMKAQDMMDKDYFSHYSPEGTTPWHWFKEADYTYKFAGENLAVGFMDSRDVYDAWLDSPSHKKNLVNSKYSDIGMAILRGNFQGNETTIVVQLFGTPLATTVKKTEPVREETPIKGSLLIEEVATETAVAGESSEQIKESPALNILYFLSFDYFDISQKIVYGFLIFIIIALLINIFMRVNMQFKDLVLKTVGFLLVLVIFVLIDKATVIEFISNEIRIN
jgi:uncharacterized protein YkwD